MVGEVHGIHAAAVGMCCELCGCTPVSNERIKFSRNVGMLFERREYNINAHLCRGCLHGQFGKFMFLNATLGWWGVISFWMTIGFFFENIAHYITALFRFTGTEGGKR